MINFIIYPLLLIWAVSFTKPQLCSTLYTTYTIIIVVKQAWEVGNHVGTDPAHSCMPTCAVHVVKIFYE